MDMIRRRCVSPNTITWSMHSRLVEPIKRSTLAFCQGDRRVVSRSLSGVAMTVDARIHPSLQPAHGTERLGIGPSSIEHRPALDAFVAHRRSIRALAAGDEAVSLPRIQADIHAHVIDSVAIGRRSIGVEEH